MTIARPKMMLYGLSLVTVLVIHVVAVMFALQWSRPQAIQLPPHAMMIDLVPMPALKPPAATKVMKAARLSTPAKKLLLPRLAEAPPRPITVVPKSINHKQKPQTPESDVKPEPVKEKQVGEYAASAQSPSTEKLAAKTSWADTLLAHLGKYKKYPVAAQKRCKEGLNRLHFVVDTEGKVLSFSLVGRSGNADLDLATLEMIRRAQPLPKPPPAMLTNGNIEIVASFVYSIDKRRR